MNNILKTGVLMTLAFGASQAIMAQQIVFQDTFGSSVKNAGSSVAPTSSSTSYDFDSGKSTSTDSVASGDLHMALPATSAAGVEAEALFTTSPITLATTGDYIDLTYTFTDTEPVIGSSTASWIASGLYNSSYLGNQVYPLAGTIYLGGTAAPTGGSQYWQGYVGRITGNGGTSEVFTRPQQTGGSASGTSSAQDLIADTAFTGAFGKTGTSSVTGVVVNPTSSTTIPAFTAAAVYTVDYRLTLAAAGGLTISDNLYTGNGVVPANNIFSQSVTTAAPITETYDGLAIGYYFSGVSATGPVMDISEITVSTDIPEPSTLALIGSGMVLLQVARRRLQTRA
jgi:hypothetical protein